jgi:hypothetical protein
MGNVRGTNRTKVPQQDEMPGPAMVSKKLSQSCGLFDQVSNLMTQTKDSYPSQELPMETSRMWVPLWVEFAEEFGLDSLRQALNTQIRAFNFFPTPANLSNLLIQQRSNKKSRSGMLPNTRAQIAKLVGPAKAAECTVCTFEDVDRWYGRESANTYEERLAAERVQGGQLSPPASSQG